MAAAVTDDVRSAQYVRVRFLTPYKLAMAAVCMLYCENKIELESRIPVMSEVIYFIDGSGDESHEGDYLMDGDLDRLSLLFDSFKTTNGDSVYQCLYSIMWTEMCSVDEMHDFFHMINYYLQDPLVDLDPEEEQPICLKVTSESVLGTFFRKCYLEFERLTFQEMNLLWEAFLTFRGKPEIYYPQQDLGALSQLADTPQNLVLIADENLDSMLEHEILLFQKYGALLLSGFQKQLLERLPNDLENGQGSALPSSVYYVRYIDACRERRQDQALENLHHFFDYALNSSGQARYQYALFTLAIMHAEFNAPIEAIKAAEEAISVARQKSDFNFLAEVISWLYRYIENNPHYRLPSSLPSPDQIAHYLKNKSWEASLNLSSLAFQSEAVRMMWSGVSPLAYIFESLTKSSFINMASNSPAINSSCYRASMHLWDRCGIPELSKVYLDLHEAGNHNRNNLQDGILKATQLLARGQIHDSYDAILSIEDLGRASVASCRIWKPNMAIIQAAKYLKERKLRAAQSIIDELKELDKEIPFSLQLEVQLLDLELNLCLQNYNYVVAKANEYAARVRKFDADILYHLKFMIFYIRAVSHTEKTFMKALTVTIRCYLTAQRASLVPICCELVVLLARISTEQHIYKDAITLIDKSMPRIFECENKPLLAEAHEVLADALVGSVTKVDSCLPSNEKNAQLDKAYLYLGLAGSIYQECLDASKGLEVCAKISVLAKMRGADERYERMKAAMNDYKKLLNDNMAFNVV